MSSASASLQSKAERMGRDVPQKVLEFLAHKITSNVRELEGALNRLVAHAELVGRPITLEAANDLLHDLLRSHERRITIDENPASGCPRTSTSAWPTCRPRAAPASSPARAQIAMYLAKQLTPRSLPEIGRKFGGRDHTTVMHAIRVIEEMKNSDAAFGEDVDLLKRMLEG